MLILLMIFLELGLIVGLAAGLHFWASKEDQDVNH